MAKAAIQYDENASRLFPYDRYELEEAVLAERYQENQPYDPLYFENFLADDVTRSKAVESTRPKRVAFSTSIPISQCIVRVPAGGGDAISSSISMKDGTRLGAGISISGHPRCVRCSPPTLSF